MKVSVVIRCYNEEEHIGKLLTGIEHQEHEDVEVIVVDSGSTDSTVAIAKKFNAKIIRIKPEEFSFGYALNVGCAQATGEVLLFASAHVYPIYSNWIGSMLEHFKDPKVALVYGKQRGEHRNKYSEHQLFKQWFPDRSNLDQRIPFCNNANCAVRRSVWEQQPFDEELTGLEDLDWAKKALAKEYRLVYDAQSVIIHVHEEIAAQIRNRYRREAIALRRINPDTKINLFQSVGLFIRNVFHDLGASVSDGKFFSKFFEIWMFRYNQFYGTYLGHKETQFGMTSKLRKKYYYPPSDRESDIRSKDQYRIHYND